MVERETCNSSCSALQVSFWTHEAATAKGGQISESVSLCLKSPKKVPKDAQENDLAPFFWRFESSERLYENRPPLARSSWFRFLWAKLPL